MGLMGGTRTTAAAGAVTMLGGITVTLYGVARSDPARSLGGVCLTMISLTVIALFFIHRWFTNTSEERRALTTATRKAQDERSKYFAARAGVENEQGRLHRDMDNERAALASQLAKEREALAIEFEERRASLIAETMEATVRMFHNGKFAPESQKIGTLIQFPEQEAARQRGVAGP